MARTVDPERHEARRLVIIDAALTRFAADGYERATTAAICREAGISSGTFFHYFPTKLGLLLAILDLGTAETRDWFAAQEGRDDGARVVLDYVEHAAEDFADPRLPGFVRAVGALMGVPEVAHALARDDDAVRSGLTPWVGRAQRAGGVRDDLSAGRLAEWVLAIVDGYVGRLASAPGFDQASEQTMLSDAVRRLMRP
ncbi:TetR/AcrR family transcriptional regulator [Nocardioides panacisoli]|uniref:TetR/AcrR family transcriptional regulator n=1 Tax=Nocardioides panacisoli TaxID=627624 RepID=UPI001C62E8CB|nr:TetR/AcrR family transcriptional regulator [Nocardioides panacisoli]QYJ05408.1 TetR/AcrR family transcriptional regulator [Nocardioides panacisoli]